MKTLAWLCVWLAGVLAGFQLAHEQSAAAWAAVIFLGMSSVWMHSYVLRAEQTESANEG